VGHALKRRDPLALWFVHSLTGDPRSWVAHWARGLVVTRTIEWIFAMIRVRLRAAAAAYVLCLLTLSGCGFGAPTDDEQGGTFTFATDEGAISLAGDGETSTLTFSNEEGESSVTFDGGPEGQAVPLTLGPDGTLNIAEMAKGVTPWSEQVPSSWPAEITTPPAPAVTQYRVVKGSDTGGVTMYALVEHGEGSPYAQELADMMTARGWHSFGGEGRMTFTGGNAIVKIDSTNPASTTVTISG